MSLLKAMALDLGSFFDYIFHFLKLIFFIACVTGSFKSCSACAAWLLNWSHQWASFWEDHSISLWVWTGQLTFLARGLLHCIHFPTKSCCTENENWPGGPYLPKNYLPQQWGGIANISSNGDRAVVHWYFHLFRSEYFCFRTNLLLFS